MIWMKKDIDPKYRDKEWLRIEYLDKGRTAGDIARECNVSERTVRWWITELNIHNQKRNGYKVNKDELFQLYRVDRKTTKEIGQYYGMSDGEVLYYLHKFDIPVFTRTEILDYYYYENGGLEKAREYGSKLENRINMSCRQRGISVEEFDGFRTTKAHNERNSSVYKEWRTNVFERDNYTCQCCGKVGGCLNAHHIQNFSEYPELKLDMSNGITLCVECHLPEYPNSFHSRYGMKNNTKEQLIEYIATRRKELEIELEEIA